MPTLKDLTETLTEKKEKVRQMGGADEVARQHKAGKLTARRFSWREVVSRVLLPRVALAGGSRM